MLDSPANRFVHNSTIGPRAAVARLAEALTLGNPTALAAQRHERIGAGS